MLSDKSFPPRSAASLSAAGVLGISVSGWFNVLANRAAGAAKPGSQAQVVHPALDGRRACPVAHLGRQAGQRLQAIATNVPGIQISEHLPELAPSK